MSSTAGFVAYEGGGGYVAAKHGEHAIAETLRLELCGQPVRVIEIAPGMVRTDEFAVNRFRGDADKAAAVYAGVAEPLTADDVADTVAWAVTRPPHVNMDLLVLRPAGPGRPAQGATASPAAQFMRGASWCITPPMHRADARVGRERRGQSAGVSPGRPGQGQAGARGQVTLVRSGTTWSAAARSPGGWVVATATQYIPAAFAACHAGRGVLEHHARRGLHAQPPGRGR